MIPPAEPINPIPHHAALYGLISGFAIFPDQRIEPLAGNDLDTALTRSNAVVWLHFNARIGAARDWIARCESLPQAARRFLLETDDRKRLERTGDGLMGVISDIRYDFSLDFDPEQIATLRFYLDRRCLISTRRQPSYIAGQLRTAINTGHPFEGTAPLLIHLFKAQVSKINEITVRARDRLDDIEDQALAGQIRDQQAQLGGIRRLAVRLHHHFAPEYRLLQQLCRWPLDGFGEADHAALQEVAEEFHELVDDLTETQERAKLLQEELAARLAEQTNKNLYVLSLFTVLLLPLTLITGLFGMNVAGVPGVKDESEVAFWWVMLGLAAVSGLVLLVLRWRRLF